MQYHYAGDRSATLENVLAVREAVFAWPAENLADLCRRLAGNLAGAWHEDLSPVDGDAELMALVKYNAGHYPSPGESYWTRYAANVANYRWALRRAAALVG